MNIIYEEIIRLMDGSEYACWWPNPDVPTCWLYIGHHEPNTGIDDSVGGIDISRYHVGVMMDGEMIRVYRCIFSGPMIYESDMCDPNFSVEDLVCFIKGSI